MSCCSFLCIGGLIVGLIALSFLCKLLSKIWRIGNLKSKSVLITGCDSGFGKALTLQLSKKGMQVFSACLTDKGKADLAGKENVDAFVMDVTNEDSVIRGVKYIEERAKNGLWGVVNNAGVLRGGNSDVALMSDWKLQFDVNVLGMACVTKYCLPLLRKTKGRIVNISSVAGRFSMPGTGAYSGSKFAVQGLSDALRRECRVWGIKVIIIEPGVMKTPLWDVPFDESAYLKSFEALDDDTKALYGKEYFEANYKNSKELIEKLANDPQLVVDKLDEALTTNFPLTRYTMGKDAIIWHTLAKLPTFMSDFLLAMDKKAPIPAALQKKSKSA